jgi:hypothetical protein
VGFRELRHVTDTAEILGQPRLLGPGRTRFARRAEMVYERSRSDLDEHTCGSWIGVRLQVLRARYCSNIGRCDEARRLALDVATHVDQWTLGPTRTALSRLEAAQALAKCGHVTEACGLLEKGLRGLYRWTGYRSWSTGTQSSWRVPQLDLGELESLWQTRSSSTPNVDFRSRCSTRSRAALGDRTARPGDPAFSALQIGLQRLAEMEAELGASPESYIALATNDELRRLGHHASRRFRRSRLRVR